MVDDLLPASKIKERGWTDKMIREFLGEPVATKPNPHWKAGSPMRLYPLKRVKQIEKQKRFLKAQEKSKNRRASSLAAAENRHEATIDAVEQLEITVPSYPWEELVEKVCADYNDYWHSRGDFEKFASPDADADFIARIVLNYLRHVCSPYEGQLAHQGGKVGADAARSLLHERINEMIVDEYPQLAKANTDDKKRRIQSEFGNL